MNSFDEPVADPPGPGVAESGLRRTVTGRQLFAYVLGDVLGSGIYVLIGAVAAAVGGAFWLAFAVGVSIATITGSAYAELVSKYPQAAGAALYVEKAFGKKPLTFLATFCMLAASFAAAGSLAVGFSGYFAELWSGAPALVISVLFVLLLSFVNFVGISQSVVANVVMTAVEVAGLVIVLVVGVITVVRGDADFGSLLTFTADQGAAIGVLAGVALAFFAMTGFENAVNIAEEVERPAQTFPRALIGGMAVAGAVYVLVAVTSALTVPIDELAGSDAPLLDVVRSGALPLSSSVITAVFAVIAMIAIANTALVALITQSRILYGMARQHVVPQIFGRVHGGRRTPLIAIVFAALVVIGLLLSGADLARMAAVTVVLVLIVYELVIAAAIKTGSDEGPGDQESFRAPRPLLAFGALANAAVLFYVVYDDPATLLYCGVLVGIGVILMVVQHAVIRRGSAR